LQREPPWFGPDGDRVRIDVLAPAEERWARNAELVSETLSAFGVRSTVRSRRSDAYTAAFHDGEFAIAVNAWGNPTASRHPHAFFAEAFAPYRARLGNFDPTAMAVPMPVGDPAGDVETVDVRATISALGSAQPDEQDSIVETLAWVYNQTLPRLPLSTGLVRRWLRSEEWDLPAPESQWQRENPVYLGLKSASIGAVSADADGTFTGSTASGTAQDTGTPGATTPGPTGTARTPKADTPLTSASPTPPTGASETRTTFAATTATADASAIQWNPYVEGTSRRTPAKLAFERPFVLSPAAVDVDPRAIPERTPMLGESLDLADSTLTLTIRDDRVWTDGDPVTATDLAVTYGLEKHLGEPSGDVWDGLYVRDERTLEFDVGDRNPERVAAVVLPRPIETKRRTQYQDWLEAFESATTDAERDDVRQAVLTTRLEEVPTYGLWRVVDRNRRRVVLEPHADHPLADGVTIDRVELHALESEQARWRAFRDGQLDALAASRAPESVEEGFPEEARRLAFEQPIGDALVFNHDREPLTDRRVRRAIAFLVDRGAHAGVPAFATPVEFPTGLTNGATRKHLGDGLTGFDRYASPHRQPAAAEASFQAAGYERSETPEPTPGVQK
jgi:ABC-type transport system substrate-binding protein